MKTKLLFDHNIEQRRIADWNALTFCRFHQATDTTRKATTACIKHVFAHYEDLPDYMPNDRLLLQRLRDIFRNEPWCKSLFEKAEQNQTALAFSELLKTASSNHDRSNPSHPSSGSSAFPVQSPTSFNDLVAAFFSKTPPPPSHRRPFRFNRFNKFHRPHKWSHNNKFRPHGRFRFRSTPPALRGKPGSRRCWGCQQEGHILRNCPEKHKHLRKFDRIRQVGTAAVMLIDSAENDPTDELDEVATFLTDFLEEMDEPENDTSEFDSWICDLLDLYDEHSRSQHLCNICCLQPSTPRYRCTEEYLQRGLVATS